MYTHLASSIELMGHHLEETFSLCKIRVESAYTGCEGRVVPLLYGRRGHAVRLSEVMGKAFARCILCFDFRRFLLGARWRPEMLFT